MNNRNEPCFCGSGKKYKKCCLIKEQNEEAKENQEFQEWFENDLKLGEKLMREAIEAYEQISTTQISPIS